VDPCSVAKSAISDEETWELASSVEPGLEATRSRVPEDDASAGVGNDVAASKGMLATISTSVEAASSNLGDGVTVGRGMDACAVVKPTATDAGAPEPASLFEPDFGSMDLAASEGDAASSGVDDGVTVGGNVGASGVAKAAKTDAGAAETASTLEPGFESWDSVASEGDAASSGVGEGVTVGKDTDACGVGKPAATDAGASVTGPLFESDFGSIGLATSEGDAASSGVGDGITAGRDVGASGVAKAAKTDARDSESASPLEPGFES
jgi:hypothetical protein